MSAPAAPVAPTLLLNASADDVVALKDVLVGLRQQGLTVLIADAAQTDLSAAESSASVLAAAPVLTVWSRQSILDERVVAMADAALGAHRLFPIRIEEVEPPLGLRQAQTFDIVNLTEEAGQALGQELQSVAGATESGVIARAGAGRLSLRALEWVLFVTLPILIYAALFKRLMHGTSDYITFIAAAFLIVDTALIGVPAYLTPGDPVRSLQKLTHCSRIDLTLQFTLALVLSLFATASAMSSSNAWVLVLFLSMLAASSLALVSRYVVVGLWLAWRQSRSAWRSVALPWLMFLLSAALLYTAASALWLPGLTKYVLFYFVALSNVQSILFAAPAFELTSAESRARAVFGLLRLSVTDLGVQGALSVAGGYVLHVSTGQPTGGLILRFAGCAAIAVVGRYLCTRLTVRLSA